MAHSAIVIPVPEFEHVVLPRMRRSMRPYLFRDAEAVHAHITLLGPFVDRNQVTAKLLTQLGALFDTVAPFEFSMSSTSNLRTFPDGAVVIEPDDPAPFLALTKTLWRNHPDYPPYGDPTRTIIPHLTLDYSSSATATAELVAEVELGLPVKGRAKAAWLTWYEPGHSAVLGRLNFTG